MAGEPETGAWWEARARERHRAVDYAGSLDAYERAYDAYRREGELLAAARAARTAGWFRGSVFGEWAVHRGWVGRARALVEQAGEDPDGHGWLLLARAQEGDDLAAQRDLYRRAITTARSVRDADLECEALGSLGIMLVFSGLVADGMALLDEALGVLCADEVIDLSVVEGVFCGLFHACERTSDVGRAEEWLRAADGVVRRRGLVAVGGYCRAYYGGLLIRAGRWEEADAELGRAAEVLAGRNPNMRELVLCRLAELRVGQGRIEEAAVLLDGLDHHEDAVRPLAGVHLARAEIDLARDVLGRALGGGGLDDVATGRLLALLVGTELMGGDPGAARDAAAALAATAAQNPAATVLPGLAAQARGRLCLADGNADGARVCLHEAVTVFARTRLPLEAAQARLELAGALAPASPTAAIAQARAALVTADRLCARPLADTASALLRTLGVATPAGGRRATVLTDREREVLVLVGHGLSNGEIAERLVISGRTVEHHVGRILAKLGLTSRAQAVAHAAQVGSGPG
ncbi:hypothetical protein Acsp06_21470 [Actinomycetospora sp. NBRC 106375]|uniref:LuxR family transcriptional regulator n=1 Tax=Actinomycetospora sp. NBRC 106375 TaxID=3032207 RepID=UPI0024A279F6|nr:LuxR family transcriptional regulator [Actinomycetospora sp. NBRC 106375]GLZ45962.1 hypothetical protein Acsp06_21470 [Actinomycetospora sp. NBRC 106375]